MRTRQAERARYSWLTTQAFADAVGVTAEQVRAYIEQGWFRKDSTPPECLDVSKPEAKKPEYRISPEALKRFYRERAA